MTVSRNRFYLNKAEGKISGVCAGFADYLGVDALWIRAAVVALTVLVSFITIPLYIIIAVLASRRPRDLYAGDPYIDDRAEEQRLERALRRRERSTRVRSDLRDMDRRLAEVEHHYTSSGTRLSAEIDRLS